MPGLIEDYAVIGDTHTAALVGRDGSIDWLCLPRFDSPACFAALLGDDDHGHWRLAPTAPVHACTRRYREDTLVLETEFDTADGRVRVVDCMPVAGDLEADQHDVVRVVEGVSGRVDMRMSLALRFQYGQAVPWVRRTGAGLAAVAGPDAVVLAADVDTRGEDERTVADFSVAAGETVAFTLVWHRSHERVPASGDARAAVESTAQWWRRWVAACTYDGPWRDAVVRSLITLKALTYRPTGGVVAAATTSLPERLGGVRNWDYRYCWLRDATLTLDSLIATGYTDEAGAWRDWLLRAVAGRPSDMQILYGPAGERWLPELEVTGLPGYEGAAPVRVGNGAALQFQLDVWGEIMDALLDARRGGLEAHPFAWRLQLALLRTLETAWRRPDEGIWEVRSGRRHFTHSKIMCWVAFDRAVRSVEEFGLDGPVERWRRLRDEIHAEVCDRGYDADVGAFTQAYGEPAVDAALLTIPLVGFLPADDPRVAGTVDAVMRELGDDGLILRYRTPHHHVDGLPPGEGAFLPCCFWLVDNLALMGRGDEAERLFERLLGLRNDVGLLSEEYDPHARRLTGNFPQAFTHTSLVRSALTLAGAAG